MWCTFCIVPCTLSLYTVVFDDCNFNSIMPIQGYLFTVHFNNMSYWLMLEHDMICKNCTYLTFKFENKYLSIQNPIHSSLDLYTVVVAYWWGELWLSDVRFVCICGENFFQYNKLLCSKIINTNFYRYVGQ